MTGRLDPWTTLAAIVILVLFAHTVLAASSGPQQRVTATPPAVLVSAVLSVPEGLIGPVSSKVPVNVGASPVASGGQGRWHSIQTYYYGGSDGLDDGTHHFADGGLFRPGTIAIASNTLPLGSWVVLRWHGRSLLAQVRDRHGRSAVEFFDVTRAASAWLFGVPRNAIVEWRVSP